jgi:glycosyltransferase involved in cell wall biosynthesis
VSEVPDISVIIPAKDRLWSLPQAVASCRSASFNVQIIVIDDASTDGTADWLSTQPDVVPVKGEGWGKPWGVNKAMGLAEGKYVRYLDSDDWLNPNANELQFEIAEKEKADVVVAGLDIYEEKAPNSATLRETQPWVATDDFIAQQLGETLGSHYSAFLFRREFAKEIPHRTLFPSSNFASNDDRCFMLEVALRHPKLAECSKPTLCHRHHNKGRLQFHGALRGTGIDIQHLYIYKRILALLERRNEMNVRRKRVFAKVFWPLAHSIARIDLDDASELAKWVFELDPDFVPLESGLLGRLYRTLGFRNTERVLRLRRGILRPFRRVRGQAATKNAIAQSCDNFNIP